MKNDGQIYNSQTYGQLEMPGVKEAILSFMKTDKQSAYRLIIGSDSQKKNGNATDFVSAIIVHRVGGGGIYFWRRIIDAKQKALKQRIFEEATLSLTTAHDFLEIFKNNGIADLNLEIHVDIGEKGPTREWITEVVAMIRGSGFTVKTKPEAYGASKVADRHT